MSNNNLNYFIRTIINNSNIVKSTKLDSIIKAIINNYKARNIIESNYIINYLNILRIIYYLKRLKYYNNNKHNYTLSKYLNIKFLKTIILTIF